MRKERRKNKRIPIDLYLEINHMFRQNNEILTNLEARIDVVNISRTGIGFISKVKLPTEYYFNAKILLGEKECIYTVVKILYCRDKQEEQYIYGAKFVGLAPFLADKITAYENTITERISVN